MEPGRPSGRLGGLTRCSAPSGTRRHPYQALVRPTITCPNGALLHLHLHLPGAFLSFLSANQVWLDYADWHASCGRADAAAATLSKAQVALPQCLQLRLLAADLHERTGNPQQVRGTAHRSGVQHSRAQQGAAGCSRAGGRAAGALPIHTVTQ